MPLLPVHGVIVFIFLFGPHVENLIHDQESHPVAQLQEFGCRRVVGGTDGVTPHPFEDLQLPFRCPPVKGTPQRSQVMVQVNPFDLQRISVQGKPPGGMEFIIPDAERGIHVIGQLPVGIKECLGPVKLRGFHRPQLRVPDVKSLPYNPRCLLHSHCGGDGSHHPAVRSGDFRINPEGFRPLLPVQEGHFQDNPGMIRFYVRSCDIGSPRRYVNFSGGDQPHIAVNSRPGIPA